MTPVETKAKAEQRRIDQRVIGQRLRRRRLEAGLTVNIAAGHAGVSEATWQGWELGSRPYPVRRLAGLAAALGIPIASLVTDELVLVEIRISDETCKRVKREGRPAAREVVERLSTNVEALLLAEVSRPAIDLSPNARAKPRRSREQVLARRRAGIAEARRRAAAVAEECQQTQFLARADPFTKTA